MTKRGANLTSTEDIPNPHDYYFSICDDLQLCDGQSQPVMVKQIATFAPELCYNLARWDESIQPVLDDSSGTDQWTFTYQNGDDDCGGLQRTWVPTFIYDPGVEAEMGLITESEWCIYSADIRTKYACEGYTTTTLEPGIGCVWENGDNKLNLTRLTGFIFNYVDPRNLIWSVSPCNNGIICQNSLSGMGTVGNLNNCIQRVALWDDGMTRPSYSTNNGGQWEFVYLNGDNCSGAPTAVIRIFWNCNPLAGTGRITAAAEKGTCDFEIQIDSDLACY